MSSYASMRIFMKTNKQKDLNIKLISVQQCHVNKTILVATGTSKTYKSAKIKSTPYINRDGPVWN